MSSPLLSIAKPKHTGSAFIWCLWLTDGMPYPPDTYGYCGSRRDAVVAAKAWLKHHGITTAPRTDRDHNANWWSRRTRTPVTEDPTLPRPRCEIPRDDTPDPSHLEILGVQWPCDEKQLQLAWRQRALETHPDAGGSDREFIAVKAAFEHVSSFVGNTGGIDG